jgi:hypothetical protein
VFEYIPERDENGNVSFKLNEEGIPVFNFKRVIENPEKSEAFAQGFLGGIGLINAGGDQVMDKDRPPITSIFFSPHRLA